MNKNILKRTMIVLLVLLLTASLCACGGGSGNGGSGNDSSDPNLKTIQVALEAPLSGAAAWSGKAMNAGCEIALEYLKDDFAALGYQIELISNDHQASSDVAATNITKDIELHHTPYVIGSYTGALAAMSQVAEDNKVVLINPLAMGEQLVGLSPWLYNICPSYSVPCEAMAKYLYEELGIRKIVTLGDDTSTSLAQREPFCKIWKSLGGTVLLDVECETNTTDFLSVCSQIMQKGPECIIMCSADEDMQQREMLQFAQLGLGTETAFAMVGPGDKNFAEDFDYESYAINVKSEFPDFVKDRYEESYKVEGMAFNSLQYTLANFGNAVYVLYDAVKYCSENGMEVTGENLKTALDSMDELQIYSGMMQFQEGNTVKTPIEIYHVVRGEAEIAATYFE